MTEEETIRLEREKNWVEERFNCSPENAFKKLLNIAREDVKAFEQLSVSNKCNCETVTEDYAYSFKCNNQVALLTFRDGVICIEFKTKNNEFKELKVVPSWDAKETRCSLIMEGRPVSFHRVSQRFLSEIMFSNAPK